MSSNSEWSKNRYCLNQFEGSLWIIRQRLISPILLINFTLTLMDPSRTRPACVCLHSLWKTVGTSKFNLLSFFMEIRHLNLTENGRCLICSLTGPTSVKHWWFVLSLFQFITIYNCVTVFSYNTSPICQKWSLPWLSPYMIDSFLLLGLKDLSKLLAFYFTSFFNFLVGNFYFNGETSHSFWNFLKRIKILLNKIIP